MGLSYSTSVYYNLVDEGDAVTAAVDVVAEGARGRLMSIWFRVAAASANANILTIKTGGSGGTVIFQSEAICQYNATFSSRASDPFSFVPNGILFTDGLNAQMTNSGMKSITVTYIGEG